MASLEQLTVDDLVRILTEPKTCMVKQYQKLLAMEGVALSFNEGSLQELAKVAHRKKTGARGLRSILEQLMLDVMFEAPRGNGAKQIKVTKAMIEREFAPRGGRNQAA
jgi:ATP-dependent Clp protease ATP-binding subunit ClpX